MMKKNRIEDEIDAIRDKMCAEMATMTNQERDEYLDRPFQAAVKQYNLHIITPEHDARLRANAIDARRR
jgi:hypothetical protein